MARAIGLDIGTSSISCVVVEESRGVIASRTVANDASSRSARSDERLQDPVRLLDLVDDAVEWASRDHPGSAALGLTGQQHGAVYLDQALHPVSPLITWQDGRGWRLFNHPAGPSDRERNAADTDHSFVGQLEDVTGYHMASGYGLTTHFVLLHAGAVPAGASCLATIADLAVARLAGLDRPVCHPSMAASLGLYDLPGQRFDLKALANAKIDPAILPTVSNNERPLGEYRGLAIVPAIGDNQASYLGAAGMAGGLLINIGTGSQISLTSGATIRTVDGLETRPHVAGNYLLVGSALCGGAAYRQLCDFFAACAGLAGARVDGPDLYEAATQAALAAMTAANGPAPLRVDTRFQGTRTDPDRRGTISGIGPD
ncbi:MAG: hypothetical protein LBU05_03860, partial [Bifidobacteriaceae bacterium]|nr:hypothetical protein [Bifidobacteriaceae bacterium]